MSKHRLHLVPQATPTITAKPRRRGRRRTDLPDHIFFADSDPLFRELNVRDLRDMAKQSMATVEDAWGNYQSIQEISRAVLFCSSFGAWKTAAYELNARGYAEPAWAKWQEYYEEDLRIREALAEVVLEMDRDFLSQMGITLD